MTLRYADRAYYWEDRSWGIKCLYPKTPWTTNDIRSGEIKYVEGTNQISAVHGLSFRSDNQLKNLCCFHL